MNTLIYKFSKMIESHSLLKEIQSEINNKDQVNIYLNLYEKVRMQQIDIISFLNFKIPKKQQEVNELIEKVLLNIYSKNNYTFKKSLISIPDVIGKPLNN